MLDIARPKGEKKLPVVLSILTCIEKMRGRLRRTLLTVQRCMAYLVLITIATPVRSIRSYG